MKSTETDPWRTMTDAKPPQPSPPAVAQAIEELLTFGRLFTAYRGVLKTNPANDVAIRELRNLLSQETNRLLSQISETSAIGLEDIAAVIDPKEAP